MGGCGLDPSALREGHLLLMVLFYVRLYRVIGRYQHSEGICCLPCEGLVFFPCTLKLEAVCYITLCHILEDCGFPLLYTLQMLKSYQFFCGINVIHVTVITNDIACINFTAL
jgi:hypothetical protein